MKKIFVLILLSMIVLPSGYAQKSTNKKGVAKFKKQNNKSKKKTKLRAKVKKQFKPRNDFAFGIGNLSQFINKIQDDDSGGKRFLDIEPVFLFYDNYFFKEKFIISTDLGFTIPKSGRDENIRRFTFYTNLLLGYPLYFQKHQKLILKGGLGLYFTKLSADGGSQSLGNGTDTIDFPLPNGSSTSQNLVTVLGTEYYFGRDFSLRFDTLTYNLGDSEARAFSLFLSANYHFKVKKWFKF